MEYWLFSTSFFTKFLVVGWHVPIKGWSIDCYCHRAVGRGVGCYEGYTDVIVNESVGFNVWSLSDIHSAKAVAISVRKEHLVIRCPLRPASCDSVVMAETIRGVAWLEGWLGRWFRLIAILYGSRLLGMQELVYNRALMPCLLWFHHL